MKYVGSGGGSKVLWEGTAVEVAQFQCKMSDLFNGQRVTNLVVSGYFPYQLHDVNSGADFDLFPGMVGSKFALGSNDNDALLGSINADEQYCEVFTFERDLYDVRYSKVCGGGDTQYPWSGYYVVPGSYIGVPGTVSEYAKRTKVFSRFRYNDSNSGIGESTVRENMGVALWFEEGTQEDSLVRVWAGRIGKDGNMLPSDWNFAETGSNCFFIPTQVRRL